MRLDWAGVARPAHEAAAGAGGPETTPAPVPGAYWPLGGSPSPVRESFADVRAVDIAAVGQVIVVNLTVMEAGQPPTACLACVDVSEWVADPQLTSSVIWGKVWRALGSDDWRTRSATRLSNGLVVLTGLVDPDPVRGDRAAT